VASLAPLRGVRPYRLLRHFSWPACRKACHRVWPPGGRELRASAGLALRLPKTQGVSRIPARGAARTSGRPAGSRPKRQSPGKLGVLAARRRLNAATSPIRKVSSTLHVALYVRWNRDQLLETGLGEFSFSREIPDCACAEPEMRSVLDCARGYLHPEMKGMAELVNARNAMRAAEQKS
jgi:hypothetical protein